MNNELADLPLISIIVPVYNVELYLHKCVDSIIKQTYKNLQIILVDDGSKDKCPDICDEYSMIDERIEVIHQVNGGLSDARNTGVKYAKGEYVFFLDSDDYIKENTIEALFKSLDKYDADMTVANYYYQYDYRCDIASEFDNDVVLDRESAMEALLKNDIVKNFAWGKLFKYDFIKDYPFPKGKLFEDTYWTHLIFDQCSKIVLLKEPLVHYYQRSNSISYTFNPRKVDLIDGLMERRDFIKDNYEYLLCFIDTTIVDLLIQLYITSFRTKEFYKYRQFRKTILNKGKELKRNILNDSEAKCKLHKFLSNPYFVLVKWILSKLRRR